MSGHLNQITQTVIGAAMEVHRALGPGLLESAYQECLYRELTIRNIPFERQRPLLLEYKGIRLECGYRLDLLVASSVVVEVKSVLLRGLLGIEVTDGGLGLRFAPQLPANWNNVKMRNIRAGTSQFDLTWKRTEGRQAITVARRELEKQPNSARKRFPQVTLAPTFPLDTHIRKATVNGRAVNFTTKELGDRQFVELVVNNALASNEIVLTYDEGTDVYAEMETLRPGASNQGLCILSSEVDEDALHLTLEGLAGRTYSLKVRSPLSIVEPKENAPQPRDKPETQVMAVTFAGTAGSYVRRELTIPLYDEE